MQALILEDPVRSLSLLYKGGIVAHGRGKKTEKMERNYFKRILDHIRHCKSSHVNFFFILSIMIKDSNWIVELSHLYL